MYKLNEIRFEDELTPKWLQRPVLTSVQISADVAAADDAQSDQTFIMCMLTLWYFVSIINMSAINYNKQLINLHL